MRGYGVHLLFHVLALAVGAGIGVAGAIWQVGHDNTALWLGLAAVVAALLLLVMQGFYIVGSDPAPKPRPVPRAAPRAQRIEPRARDTTVQPARKAPPVDIDEETRSPAMEALKEHQQG
jgi:hypothetical protein